MAAPDIEIEVRFFAAARAAAGTDRDVVALPAGSGVGDLIGVLRGRGARLSAVLNRCSYLCDGYAVRDFASPLRTHQIVDALPPFAGG